MAPKKPYRYRHGWIPIAGGGADLPGTGGGNSRGRSDGDGSGRAPGVSLRNGRRNAMDASTRSGGTSQANALSRDYGAKERKARLSGMSEADLHATDRELSQRAASLGQAGKTSKTHQAVKDEMERRSKQTTKKEASAMNTTTTAYASIVKHERDAATGDLLVYGRATSDDLDLDQQVCDPTWLGKAMPEWFASGANVREQHSSIAAGIGTELKQLGSAWDLSSRVVDPVSARKVEAGVLKGYSVGIRNAQVVKDAAAPNGRIVGGQIVEVSLVDRPANPTCTLTLAKALKPGPSTATAEDVDAERKLLKVEELSDRTGEPLAALKALLPDLAKGDPARQGRDIAGANDAIATIGALIQSEAECLADGSPSEACDIELLLSAVRSLEWFIRREKESVMAHTTVDLAAEATTEKSTGSQTDVVEDDVEEFDDLTELVKAAVAEAVAPIQAQLAKAMEQPAPGGPVLTRTTEDTTKAVAREGLLAKAAEYERIAYGLTGADRDSYLQLAADTRAGATTSR